MTTRVLQASIVSPVNDLGFVYYHLFSHLAEGPHRSLVSHTIYWLLSFMGVPDHRVRLNVVNVV